MIRTLIVEDDPVLADAHRVFTERVPGFEVVGVAQHGAEALRLVGLHQPDLVLLDFYLPDMTGLDVCRALRAGGSNVDVIAVTSARDLNAVRSAVSLGVVQYLLKPFAFAAFRERLEAYGEYRRRTAAASGMLGQAEVDVVLRTLHDRGPGPLPKGVSDETLTAIVSRLRSAAQAGQTSADLADAVGVSRPTARRYLEYLAAQRLVRREPRYGRAGRPENVYRWSGPPAVR